MPFLIALSFFLLGTQADEGYPVFVDPAPSVVVAYPAEMRPVEGGSPSGGPGGTDRDGDGAED